MDALVETLLAHDEWANRTLLEAAAALPAEEWGRERRPGLGSLGRTLARPSHDDSRTWAVQSAACCVASAQRRHGVAIASAPCPRRSVLAQNAASGAGRLPRIRSERGSHRGPRHDVPEPREKAGLGHLVEVADFFADAFAGRAYRMRNDFRSGALGADALLGELARAHPELRRAVRNALAAGGPARTIELPHGTGRHVAVHVALAQFADHGGHHRAQVQHLLREAGHPAVPEVHPLRFAGLDA